MKINIDINELRLWTTNQRVKAPHVAESIRWFNETSYWVSTTIINNGENYPKQASKTIQYWLEIMKFTFSLSWITTRIDSTVIYSLGPCRRAMAIIQ